MRDMKAYFTTSDKTGLVTIIKNPSRIKFYPFMFTLEK